jgi:hypothetical protein
MDFSGRGAQDAIRRNEVWEMAGLVDRAASRRETCNRGRCAAES